MTILNRRGFVKSILTTAVGAPSAYAAFSRGVFSNESDPVQNLENGGQQLRLSPVGTPLTFQNYLHGGNEWRPSTLSGDPIVGGPSFPLTASSILLRGNAAICVRPGS